MKRNCPCGKLADTRGLIYKTKEEKWFCFSCAFAWLLSSSRCPICSKGLPECQHRKLALDRGITPMYIEKVQDVFKEDS
jgi:hypothetical protein